MSDSQTFQSKNSFSVYLRLLTYVRSYWFWFFLSIIGYAMYASSQPLYAKMVEYFFKVIDASAGDTQILFPFLGPMSQKSLAVIIPVTLVFISIYAGAGLFLGSYFLIKVSLNIVNSLRRELFSKLIIMPCEYFDNKNSGYVLSKIVYNTSQVTGAASEALKVIVREGLTVVFLLGYLFYTQWQLTLMFLLISPVIGISVSYLGKKFRYMSHKIQNSMGDVSHIASEAISNYRTVRSFGGEEYEKRRFFKACVYNMNQSLKMSRLNAFSTPILRSTIMFSLSIMMYIALFMKGQGSITASQLVSFLTAASMIPKPLRQLSEVYGEIYKGIAAAESIFNLIDLDDEDDSGTYQDDKLNGKIEFKNLSFSYSGVNTLALDNINFTIEPGESIALVGHSGSGKTTLVSLILRFYELNSGKILVDNRNIKDFKLTNLRHNIAMVNQNISIFSDTILRNIAYGKGDNINEKKVKTVAKSANIDEYIESLSEGYNTYVGESGVKLSGGQRQRIAIARALYKNSPILILDEATSALDSESERQIQQAMDEVMKNRTTIIVAHRLSTIKKVDKIIVMDHGRIVEVGNHNSLLKKNGYFSRFYKMQFSDKKK